MGSSRANNTHTWSGNAGRRPTVRKQPRCSVTTLILLAGSVSQVFSVQTHISLRLLPHRRPCAASRSHTCASVHVKVAHLRGESVYFSRHPHARLRFSLLDGERPLTLERDCRPRGSLVAWRPTCENTTYEHEIRVGAQN